MIKGELALVYLYRPYWHLDTLPQTNIMNSAIVLMQKSIYICISYWLQQLYSHAGVCMVKLFSERINSCYVALLIILHVTVCHCMHACMIECSMILLIYVSWYQLYTYMGLPAYQYCLQLYKFLFITGQAGWHIYKETNMHAHLLCIQSQIVSVTEYNTTYGTIAYLWTYVATQLAIQL